MLLKELLDELLLPEGFQRNKRGLPVYKRELNGRPQEIGLRRSFTGGKEYAVYFEVPEEETSYELSHVCPLKNTFWWPDNLSDELEASLRSQIKQIAMHYFNSPPEPKVKGVEDIPAFRGLLELSSPFSYFEDGLWRMREGGLVDMVSVELLANNTIAYVYVIAWHQSLLAEGEECTPDNITRVTFRTVGNAALDKTSHRSYFRLGCIVENSMVIEESICSVIAGYFESICSVEDVKDSVLPEYRKYVKFA